MVFIRSPVLKNLKTLHCNEKFLTVSKLIHLISMKSGLPKDLILIYYNGKVPNLYQEIPHDSHIDVCFRMCGGKGGFGSMLRAIGAQIEKTTNREACRDLSGRRLRDINEEQRLKRWLAKKAEREAEQLKRRKEKLERMKAQPRHEFHDPEYNKERSELTERIDDALSEGLKKSLSKKHQLKDDKNDEPPTKKKRAWLDDEMLSDLSDNDSDLEHHPSICESSTSSNSLDPCSSSSNQNSNEATTSQSTVTFQESSETDQTNNLSETVMDAVKSEEVANTQTNISGKNQEQENKEKILQPNQHQQTTENSKKEEDNVDLMQFSSTTELENLGLDKLKSILIKMGLKCGGTLTERASRLWTVRDMDPKDYPQALKSKPNKK